jgi:hypothetical protein
MINSFFAGGLVEGWAMQIAGGEKICHTQVIIIGVHILILNLFQPATYKVARMFPKYNWMKELSTQCN